MRKRVNTRLPKAVEDISKWMIELEQNGKAFKIRGMTFEELNAHQEDTHHQQVTSDQLILSRPNGPSAHTAL